MKELPANGSLIYFTKSKREASIHSSPRIQVLSIQARPSDHQIHLHDPTVIMSINSGNVFSAMNLSEHMYQSLPKESTPHLKNPYDAIALLSHACMLAVGFRIIGLGEDHKIGTRPDTKVPSRFARLTALQNPKQRVQTPDPCPENGTPPRPTTTPSATPTANPLSNTSSKSAAWAPNPSSTAWRSETTKCAPLTSSPKNSSPNPHSRSRCLLLLPKEEE